MAGEIWKSVQGGYGRCWEKMWEISDSEEGGSGMCYVLDTVVETEKEVFVAWGANGRILIPTPPPSMNSWTLHMHN